MSDDLDEITKLVQPVIRVIAASVHQLEQSIIRDEIAKSTNSRAVRKWVRKCRPNLIQEINLQIACAFSVVGTRLCVQDCGQSCWADPSKILSSV